MATGRSLVTKLRTAEVRFGRPKSGNFPIVVSAGGSLVTKLRPAEVRQFGPIVFSKKANCFVAFHQSPHLATSSQSNRSPAQVCQICPYFGGHLVPSLSKLPNFSHPGAEVCQIFQTSATLAQVCQICQSSATLALAQVCHICHTSAILF